jgi:hypothetical protein
MKAVRSSETSGELLSDYTTLCPRTSNATWTKLKSWIWNLKSTDISEELVACLHGWRVSQTRNKHGAGSKQTSVDFRGNNRHYIAKDINLLNHRPENFKSYMNETMSICINNRQRLYSQQPQWSVIYQCKSYKIIYIFFNLYSGGWNPRSTRHCGHQWPIVAAPADYDDGEIGGMIGRGHRNTRRKPAPVPLCTPQTPHAARTRTRDAAMGSSV